MTRPRKVWYRWVLVGWFLLCSNVFVSVVTANANESSKDDGLVLKIVETEVWDAKNNTWKARSGGGGRWTSERGQASPAPSEVSAPEGYDFDGDWKIVVSGSDSMGWEYAFNYLEPPKRKRVWLRSVTLKAVPTPPVPAISKPTGNLARTLSRIRDGYNFKGFNIYVYKSLLSMETLGVQLGMPLTMNFDLWDRNPGLPSVSTSVALFFPWTIATYLSASVHVEWVRWVLKTILYFMSRIFVLLTYQFILPAVWAAVGAVLQPLRVRLPPLPESPRMSVSRPRYNPEILERIGCSLSYRWSKQRGLEGRFNYWHTYLPTFSVYRKILQMNTPFDWWQKHIGVFGLSSGYPLPLPPHFSCSACLAMSGLYFRSQGAQPYVLDAARATSNLSPSTSIPNFEQPSSRVRIEPNDEYQDGQKQILEGPEHSEQLLGKSARLVASSKAIS